ncbi:MAG: phage tail tape measure protein [Lachnospiraceae bacterium]|nr:phage tail tape measure protein [Lachnospiraceae bacterium]
MPSGRIKGITIELDGNATHLVSSFKEIDSHLAKTQSALRDVNKLLKFDPANAELLSQKQKLLASSIEDTKKKLDTLKEADKQAKQQLANGEMGQAEYDALQREIIDTEQKLKSLEEQAKKMPTAFQAAMSAAGKKISETGDKIKSFGDSMTKQVTAPIVAVGTASLAAFNEVDKGMDIVLQKTGASGEALEDMENAVKKIAKTIPTSFETAGTAVGEVNTRFGLVGEELEDLSTRFIKFADLNSTDVNNSIDMVQKSLAAFGKGSESAGHLLDVMNKVGQDTGVSMDSLSSSLVANAAALQEMGLSMDDSVVFMGQLEKSGASADTVLSGLRKAMKNSAAEGKDMNTALAELQDSILNGTDSMDGLTAAYDLFGKSGDMVYAAIQNGTLDFNNLSGAALDCEGSVTSTYENMSDASERFQTVLNAVMELGYEIGEALMPTIQQVIEQILPVIQGLIDKWNSLSPEMQQFIIKAALVVAAIGPVVSAIGSVISIIGSAVGAFGTVVSFLGGPLTIAIGAAIALGVALYKNWDTVKTKAGELAQSVKQKFDDIKNGITEKIETAKEKVSSAIEKIKGFFNFTWSLPKLKMPHISISGSFSLMPPKVPKFSIDWYKKAMDNAMILDGAQIFGMMNGQLLGGGEAGKEMVVGQQSMMDMIKDATSQSFGSLTGTITSAARSLLNVMVEYFPQFANMQMVTDTGALVGELKYGMDAELGKMSGHKERNH